MIDGIEVSVAGGVQSLRFHRPGKKNALNQAMYETLTTALLAGESDPGIAAHVFLGSGGVFSAGNDIGDFLSTIADGGGTTGVLQFMATLPKVTKPLLAAVDGAAVGIAVTLLFHCDLVYASPAATFSTPFLDLGLVPENASSLLAPRAMGHTRAFELLVLGEPFDAGRALSAGLVNAVVEDAEASALGAARRLAAKPPEALRISRALLRGDPHRIAARADEETAIFGERLRSPEAREALTAFLEKRPPDFAKLRTPSK